MSICREETNHIFLLSVRQDPFPRRATLATTPDRFALISKRNNVDQNQFYRFSSGGIRLRAFMSIFIKKYYKLWVFGRKGQAFFF